MTSKSGWDVAVVGSANTDFLVRGPKLPAAGETVEGEDYHEGAGGKGANQAVAAARLGARTAFVARIGRDRRGDELARRLEAEGVDLRGLSRDPESPTGAAVIMVDRRGEKAILVAPGANGRMGAADVEAAADVIRAARVVLCQLEIPLEAVLAACRLARAAEARVVLDPAPARPLPDELLPLLDVIRPNASEAEALTGLRVQDRDSARRAAEWLLARGVGAAAVQAAGEGDLLVWPGGECWLPRLPVQSIDATGAGDAFAAGLAVMLAEGRPWAEAGPFANAAAALATTAVGAQAGLPRREAVYRLLAETAATRG
jgi:ribokinase